jgi:hypothetical protein
MIIGLHSPYFDVSVKRLALEGMAGPRRFEPKRDRNHYGGNRHIEKN